MEFSEYESKLLIDGLIQIRKVSEKYLLEHSASSLATGYMAKLAVIDLLISKVKGTG